MSHSTKSFVALALLACMASASAQQAPVLDPNGKAVSISAGSRAMPTQTTSVVEPARYQHVFVDSKSPSGRTVQTISLQDAVANDVLASSELEIQRQQAIERGSLVWIVTEAGGVRRPSDLEGAGGEGAAAVNASEVNFALNEADILNPERLSSLLRVASRLNGVFHVVGYADETGPESLNAMLSKQRADSVAQFLKDQGVNESRIQAKGAGVSLLYPGLPENRRATVVFMVTR